MFLYSSIVFNLKKKKMHIMHLFINCYDVYLSCTNSTGFQFWEFIRYFWPQCFLVIRYSQIPVLTADMSSHKGKKTFSNSEKRCSLMIISAKTLNSFLECNIFYLLNTENKNILKTISYSLKFLTSLYRYFYYHVF